LVAKGGGDPELIALVSTFPLKPSCGMGKTPYKLPKNPIQFYPPLVYSRWRFAAPEKRWGVYPIVRDLLPCYAVDQ
jgi:hypothetical protein